MVIAVPLIGEQFNNRRCEILARDTVTSHNARSLLKTHLKARSLIEIVNKFCGSIHARRMSLHPIFTVPFTAANIHNNNH